MGKVKVAFFGPVYGVGGAGHVCSDVGKELGRKGYDVDFLVDGGYSVGSYLEDNLPKTCTVTQITDVGPKEHGYNLRYYGSLFQSLREYLRDKAHVIMLSNSTKYNIISVWAAAFSSTVVDLHLIEHNVLAPRISGVRHVLPLLVRTHYPFADSVIGVSSDITREFITDYGLDPRFCTTVENPVDVDRIATMAEESVEHSWFSGDVPVIVGVGRLVGFKQFSVLLSAFHGLHQRTEARLVMLGGGPRKDVLKQQSKERGIGEQVDFLGFVDNPYKYMLRADLLAHSSRYEGFGLVLVEALACGTPVVATNCPGGPSDILNDGEYGELVDVGDPRGLADAMARTLDDPPDPDRLVERAQHYRVEKVADRYAEVIDRATK